MSNLGSLYAANFLLSFHLFLVIYINSSFLNQFTSERFIGTIYIIASVLGIFSLLAIAHLLTRFGNYRLMVFFTILQIAFFLGFALLNTPFFIIPLFILYLINYPLILYTLDIFLESSTTEESTTGSIRGTFLTTTNIALILAPLVAGFIIVDSDFWKVYLVSSLFLVPFLFLMRNFKDFKNPPYHKLKLWSALSCIFHNKNIYSIMMANFIMRIFFSWMVIYMPIYLVSHIGFSWAEFGIMTFIVLIPFALFELPAGKIADRYLGEKELLALGFFIAAVFTGFLSLIETNNFVFWATVLFTIRIGVSLIEIMTESYFFKHVSGEDNNTISFFRMMRPAAYIVGPIIATISLSVLDFKYIWLVLGFILLYGLRYAFAIQDTR